MLLDRSCCQQRFARTLLLIWHECLQAHLDEGRDLQQKIPKEAKPLLLPAVACGLYLDALQNSSFDVSAQTMLTAAYTPFWHQLQVKRHYLLGTY